MLVEIVPYDSDWPSEFELIASTLRKELRDPAIRIDHVGSTAVPGLSAKDVIDVQVSVPSLDDPSLVERIEAAGFVRSGTGPRALDHVPAGSDAAAGDWTKLYFNQGSGRRPAHLHVRLVGSRNARYALLFRDFLRHHPDSASTYGEFKTRLAALSIETAVYALIKDPVCDLIIATAERWAAESGWSP